MSKLLYDALCFNINKKEHTKYLITLCILSLQHIRMSGKNINFDDKKIRKSNFYKDKKINNIEDIDVNNMLVSRIESYGNKDSFKYFIGYNDNDIIRPLCIRLSKMTGYARKFGENATMSFIVKNKQLLKKYTKICEKSEGLIKINLESMHFYRDHDKYIKTKIKMYAGNIITNFHNKKMPKEKAPCKCLSIIMTDSVIRVIKNYYPQTLLEECTYIQEKIKIVNYIDEDLEDSESDDNSNDETESDIVNEE